MTRRLFSHIFMGLLTGFVFVILPACPAEAQVISFQADNGGLALTDTFVQNQDNYNLTFTPRFGFDFDQHFVLNAREAYLDWHLNSTWDFSVGRKIIIYGPGRYGSPILGGQNTNDDGFPNYTPLREDLWMEGYDQLGYSFQWGTLNYHHFYANASEEGELRVIHGQRTTWDWGNWTFGVSDIALLQHGAPGVMYSPIPFIPFFYLQEYGQRHHIKNMNARVNDAINLDVAWQPDSDQKYYVVYYIDDRPDPGLNDSEWAVGYQLGMEWREPFRREGWVLYLEYTRIDDYTYHSPYSGGLTYRGAIIGESLGPDADRLNLELVRHPDEAGEWSMIFVRERHGEGELGDEWSYVPGRQEVFLTGVVETTYLAAVKFGRDLGPVKAHLTVGVKKIDNDDHQRGAGETGLMLKLSGEYKF